MSISLVPIRKGQKAVINNIFFSAGSAKLGRKSRLALNKVARLILENPGLRFEIRGHTDDRGGEAKNIRLSEARAKNVLKYLVKKKVPADRLQVKGMGESEPVVPNTSMKNRAKNRRIEFFVLE